ncbi:MAG: hypothetical protein WCS49_01120 [Bacilli bacterium]
MADYIYIDDYLKHGKLAISSRVFHHLASESLKRIPGISVSQSVKSWLFLLNAPIKTSIHHGIVHVAVTVDVAKDTNIQEVSRLIQDEINNIFIVSTEQIPFDVQVRVASII